MNPTNLYDYYKNQGKVLPSTVEARFADPTFAAAAKEAGYDQNSYKINKGNASINTAILQNLLKGTQGTTTSSTTPTTTVSTSTPIGTAFQMPTVTTQSDAEKAYQDLLAKQARGEDIIDTGKIRSDTLAQFQDRINALNQVYDQQLQAAKQAGIGRTGQGTAILANRGLAGSTRGAAIATGIENQNIAAENAVQAERAAAIASVYDTANTQALQLAQQKREAMLSGAKDYVDFLKNQSEVKKSNVNNTAAAFISQGIDPNNLTPEELNKISTTLGVTTNDIISAYKTAKKEQEKAVAEANKPFVLSEGQARYEYDPVTGQYKQIAARSKTYAPKGTTGTSVGGSSTYKTDLDATIGNAYNLIQSKNGKEAFASSIKSARNEGDKINAIASVVLKNSPAQVRQDFTNQAIGIKNIDKAIALIDQGTKTGVLNNAAQYTYNIFGKDFDPNLAAVQAYITSAIQPYRNSITGAAWGDQEDAEYSQLFGNTKYSPAELKSRLERIKGILADKSSAALNSQINPISEYNPFSTTPQTVTVQLPDGRIGTIPAANLPAALAAGAKQI